MSKERLDELKKQRKLSTSYSPSGILGHGFGWSNIFNYVEIHEGDIEIHSSIGSEDTPSGTEVIVKLPRARKSPQLTPA